MTPRRPMTVTRIINTLHHRPNAVVIAFSACRGDSTDKYNTKLCQDSLEAMPAVPFTPAKGMYKGQAEDSFVCIAYDKAGYNKVIALADFYRQESVLVIQGEGGEGRLRFLSPDAPTDIALGRLVRTLESDLPELDAYTILPNGDTFHFE